MQQEDVRDAAVARHYDTPGTGMFAPEVLAPTVERLVELADGGAALEFAIGTGRVAVPLAERGVPVTGIAVSGPIVEQLRIKADEATIPVVMGDMATTAAPGAYTLVHLVHNTISPLLTQAEQIECFRNAARHLQPGGRFVVELPELRRPHRYIWPSELDLMAQLAGFERESRRADWEGTEFTAESGSHVSVYRLAAARRPGTRPDRSGRQQPQSVQRGTQVGEGDRVGE